jgi:hypothetical protein
VATGYGGTYRATVVDNTDPTMQNRLLVVIPEVTGTASAWAMPSFASSSEAVPSVGEDVYVSFEHGDSDYPVWQSMATSAVPGQMGGVYPGMYRGAVMDNIDPMQSNRLLVSVPEVAAGSTMWATRAPSLGGSELPALGETVWVQFENDDPSYPVWVGVAQ